MNHLVVARHEEDVSWLADVPADWQPLVVQKGVHLPNVGREASSYFWALHHLRPTLAPDDVVCCVQGNPFAHCDDLYEQLALPTEHFRWIGGWVIDRCDANGQPHDAIPVADYYERWLKRRWPGNVSFVAGAQFLVTGREVCRYPRSHYSHMRKEMSRHKAAWVMERLWEQLLSDRKD